MNELFGLRRTSAFGAVRGQIPSVMHPDPQSCGLRGDRWSPYHFTMKRFLRVRWDAQAVILAVAGLLLTAAGSPVELMPRDGRKPLFGPEAWLQLTPAEDNDSRHFGRRPPLDRSGAFGWRVRWTGDAYDVFDWPETRFSSRNGRIVLRPVTGSRRLYVLQMAADDPGEEDAVFDPALLWRLSARE